MPTPLVAAALGYAALGMDVFPVNPTNKAPYVSQKNATTVPDLIEAWWRRHPDAIIGHRLAPDHIILDVDPRHGGDQTWQALLGLDPELPPRRQHHSGRGDGGFHAWYTLNGRAGVPGIRGLNEWAEARQVGQAIKVEAADGGDLIRWVSGIDILRHDHRYTILPPSPHPATGLPYKWDTGDDPPGPLPDSIADLLYLEAVEVLAPAGPPVEGAVRLTDLHTDSPVEWYNDTTRWADLLEPLGWRLVSGTGDGDRSMWKHPTATSEHEHSASVRGGRLYVYSDNTPFDVTTDGQPRGYSKFEAFALLAHRGDMAAAARVTVARRDSGTDARSAVIDVYQQPVDVDEVELIDWSVEHDPVDDLIEGLIIPGRWTQFVAPAKAGKSTLMLYMAASLSLGIDPFDHTPTDPVVVLYCDGEMGRADLAELIEACGHDPRSLDRLWCTNDRPPLNKSTGGAKLLRTITRLDAQLVVLDGLNGFVSSDVTENSDEAWRAVMDYLVQPLKSLGVAILSGDNMGKDATKGSRGSSVKNDKADAVIAVTQTDTGVRLHPSHTRGGGFLARDLDLDATGLDRSTAITYRRTGGPTFPAGTGGVAKMLDALGVPLDEGRVLLRKRLKAKVAECEANGTDPTPYKVSTDVLRGAMLHRRNAAAVALTSPAKSGVSESDLFDDEVSG